MKKQSTSRWALPVGGLLFIFGMLCALQWDLTLSQALYCPTWMPAIVMESHGFYTLYLPCLLWLFFLGAKRRLAGAPLWQSFLLYLTGAAATALLFWSGLHGLEKRNVAGAFLIHLAVWAVLLVGGVLLAFYSKTTVQQMEFSFRWSVIFALTSTAVINIMKLVWSRTRFDDMLAANGNTDAFTSWLHPFANGGSSFPSGHTAAACGIFVLVLLCDVLPAWHKKRTLVWGVCWAYIAFMAFTRIVIGRHFLSDTLMAGFVCIVVFYILIKSKPYQTGLQRFAVQPQNNL